MLDINDRGSEDLWKALLSKALSSSLPSAAERQVIHMIHCAAAPAQLELHTRSTDLDGIGIARKGTALRHRKERHCSQASQGKALLFGIAKKGTALTQASQGKALLSGIARKGTEVFLEY